MNKVKKKNLFSYSETDFGGSSRSSSASRKGESFRKSRLDKSIGNKSIRSGRSGRSGRSVDSRRSGKSGLGGAGGAGGVGGNGVTGGVGAGAKGSQAGAGSRDGSPMNRWRDSPWNDRRLRKKKKKMTKKQKERVQKMGAIYG